MVGQELPQPPLTPSPPLYLTLLHKFNGQKIAELCEMLLTLYPRVPSSSRTHTYRIKIKSLSMHCDSCPGGVREGAEAEVEAEKKQCEYVSRFQFFFLRADIRFN